MSVNGELKYEFKQCNEKWSDRYKELSTEMKTRLIKLMRARRQKWYEERKVFDQRQKDEPIPFDRDISGHVEPGAAGGSVGPFRFSSGGGTRNIRSAASLS